MDKIIKDLEIKTWIKNEENFENEHSSGEKEQENSNLEPAAVNVFQNITDDCQDLSVAVESKQKRIINEGSHPPHVVAFYAYLCKPEGSPGLHHTLITDTVITNVRGSYNQHDGVFTAPISGIYVLNWIIYSGNNGDIVSELMVNSDRKGGIRSDSLTVRVAHSSSGCIVEEISQGDIVFIRTQPTNSQAGPIFSYPGYYESSFSGWCLK